jgi:diguanylate cyclase (GGDEF)-like protein/PAS domain S-box-containing protein
MRIEKVYGLPPDPCHAERSARRVLTGRAKGEVMEDQVLYQTLLEYTREVIVLSSFDGSRRYVSPSVTQVTGWTPEEYQAQRDLDVVHPDDLASVKRAVEDVAGGTPSRVFRYRARQKSGDYLWVEESIREYVDPQSKLRNGYVSTVRDIHEQKNVEDQLAARKNMLSELALRDDLTGISNRYAFDQSLESEARRLTRNSRDTAMLIVDVDLLTEYNDAHGERMGDQLLKRVAMAIMQIVRRDSDIVARYRGGAFVMLLPMTDRKGAEFVAQCALEAVRALAIPHPDSATGWLTVSVGGACWPAENRIDPDWFLQQADTALFRAKSLGKDTYSMVECRPTALA